MKRKQSVIEVKILLDPVPGWGHEAEDHVKLIQQTLDSQVKHYKPEVRLLRTEIREDVLLAETTGDPLDLKGLALLVEARDFRLRLITESIKVVQKCRTEELDDLAQ